MYSVDLTRMLAQLEGSGSFPSGWSRVKASVDTDGSLAPWFRGVVDARLGGRPEAIRIEARSEGGGSDLGVLALAKRDGGVLSFACIEAIVVVGGDLESLYCGEKVDARYHRLDYHPDKLGELFCEPLPHMHLRPDGPPRVAVGTGPNPVVDFFDLLYRNYFPGKWLARTREIWRDACLTHGYENTLPVLERAFRTEQSKLLVSRYARDLDRLRAALRTERGRHLKRLRVETAASRLLGDLLHAPSPT